MGRYYFRAFTVSKLNHSNDFGFTNSNIPSLENRNRSFRVAVVASGIRKNPSSLYALSLQIPRPVYALSLYIHSVYMT